jgi:choline dehydrogenase-like flavoprotein
VELARAGLRVLVLERGRWVDRDDTAWDPIAIQVARKYRGVTPYEVDERWGRKTTYSDDAVGGKSVFYGAASLRLREQDFETAARFGDRGADGIPDMDWPIRYADLAPYYDEAERALGVAGVAGLDPTEPPRASGYPAAPPPYGTSARRIAEAAAALGLTPYPIPLAINFGADAGRPRCILCMTCDLFPCKICAKNDVAVTLLAQAQRLGARVRSRTLARRLVIERQRVRAVECLDLERGTVFTVSCDACLVAGGAIGTAALLLASGLGAVEPNGCLVGRHLMRHCSGIVIGIFPFRTNPERQFHKQVAIADFYFGRPGRRPVGPWGMIQALQTPPPEFIEHSSPYPFPIGAIGARTVQYHAYLLCLSEDLPRAENHVEVDRAREDANGVPLARVFHRYAPRDLAARRALSDEAARILRKAGALLRVRLPIHTYSHAVGTCRFGTDPGRAVLDPWCRFFGVANLFVVDGSFLPSSGGVNPSLTIAANGLRVGRRLAACWDEIVRGRG